MTCSQCHREIPNESKFCPFCGNSVTINHNMTSEISPVNKKTKKLKWFSISSVVIILIGFVLVFKLGIIPSNIEKIKDSVVMIEVYDDSDELIATGSGFCAYNSNWIVTNFHVIEGAKKVKIITDEFEESRVREVVFFNKAQDLAVLLIDKSLTPLKLGNGYDIKIQDKVVTIGSPKGEQNTVSEGIISNVDEKNIIRISAPISHGSSGGVLLNNKNEVIGITSAGYDDAQNLNFAINISVLNYLYSQYENNDVESITNKNLTTFLGTLFSARERIDSETTCYSSDINTFHILTNDRKKFEYLLRETDMEWYSIYEALSYDEKESVVSLYEDMWNYEFGYESIKAEIWNWDVTDFFMNLTSLNRYQYAITAIDILAFEDGQAMFDHINNIYPLEVAEKSLILYLIGDLDWSEIHIDNKEDIFNYYDGTYTTEDFGAILEVLGYEVEYNDDGTLTAYW